MSQIRTNSIVPSGGVPAGATGGGIIQIVNAVKNDTQSTTSTTYVDISGLSVSITPRSASNKILVIVTLGHTSNSTGNATYYNLLRGSTTILQHNSGSGGTFNAAAFTSAEGGYGNSRNHEGQSIFYTDSPATTSSTTYKVQMKVSGDTGYINRWALNADVGGTSSITVMEISG
jgi:hypothetical protein